jgi:glycosyltransferase involved in cell wall biosynthesis
MASSTLVVFSKYFGYAIGGAEQSVLALAKRSESEGKRIVVVRVDSVRSLGAQGRLMKLPSTWEILPLRLPVDWFYFRYYDYLINRTSILSYFRCLPPDWELLAYGDYAPASILGFRGRATYTARDEYGLGWDRNYYSGPLFMLRELYQALQYPARVRWLADLKSSIGKAGLLANSSFIARELQLLAGGGQVRIVRPEVDCESIRRKLAEVHPSVQPLGIVVVGDGRIKGGDITRRVAKALPSENFYLFDKRIRVPTRKGNLTFLPWQTEPTHAYQMAKLVMVPSRWEEAYPRVIIEAQCLGLPVVASCRGGIPEALANPRGLVQDIDDASEWVARIRELLDDKNTKALKVPG